MRQPEPNRDSEAFLSALADELSAPPDDLTMRRHVEAAAFAARSARSARRAHVTRWAAAVMAFATVFGTGGIAVAGGLPASLQAVVADVARALPVPFHVPYPTIPTESVAGEGSDDAGRGPEDAEVEVAPREVIDTRVAPAPRPETLATGSDVGTTELDPTRDKDGDRARCDLEDLVDDWDRLDADQVRDLRDQIRQACGFDLVDPPGWAQGLLTDDQDRDDDRRKRDDDPWDEERRAGDRDRDETGGRDGDFGSSESEGSGETSESASDEQEERHDDEDDDDRSSDDEWRDRHD